MEIGLEDARILAGGYGRGEGEGHFKRRRVFAGVGGEQ